MNGGFRWVPAMVVTAVMASGCAGGGTEIVTPPTTAAAPIPTVVDSGTVAGATWQLVAEPADATGLFCARLTGPFQFGGRVCNAASEQDFNGNDTLRYSTAGDGTFVIGVTRPDVATVRMELRGASAVERATVAAPFTAAARFVALPTTSGAILRSLTAVDGRGDRLTTITVNP
jgi:hypothetical protein